MIEKAQNSNDYEDYFAVAQEYFNEGKYDDARNLILYLLVHVQYIELLFLP